MGAIIGYKRPKQIMNVTLNPLEIERRNTTVKRIRPKQVRIPMANRQVFKYDELPESVQGVIQTIRHYTEIPEEQILGSRRQREMVVARQMCMHFCLMFITESQSQIGKWFNRDHSTVYNADYRILAYRDTDRKFFKMYHQVRNDLVIRLQGVEKEKSYDQRISNF